MLGYFSYLPVLHVSNYCLLNEDENYEKEKALSRTSKVWTIYPARCIANCRNNKEMVRVYLRFVQMGSQHPCHFFVFFHCPDQKVVCAHIVIFVITSVCILAQYPNYLFMVC